MARRSSRAEVRAIQTIDESLKKQPVDPAAEFRPLHETTTVAVRLLREDADAVMSLAASQGVPASTLLRAWILAGLRHETDDSVGATLTELERGLRQLRRALG